MAKWVKVGGVWTDVTAKNSYVKVAGVWTTTVAEWVKVSGTWQAYKQMGPFSVSYLGHVAGNTMSTATWDLGSAYTDRMVFVCSIGNALTAVSIGGVAGTLVASETSTLDKLQIWCVKSPPGAGSTIISATGANASNRIAVYVLGGGIGMNPTFDTAAGSQNNSNLVTAFFSTSAPINSIVIGIACKYGGTGAAVNSNVSPETSNFSSVLDAYGTMAGSFFGPSTGSVASPSVAGTGSDSSKPIQVCGIKFTKV